jgi:hypothetical protein
MRVMAAGSGDATQLTNKLADIVHVREQIEVLVQRHRDDERALTQMVQSLVAVDKSNSDTTRQQLLDTVAERDRIIQMLEVFRHEGNAIIRGLNENVKSLTVQRDEAQRAAVTAQHDLARLRGSSASAAMLGPTTTSGGAAAGGGPSSPPSSRVSSDVRQLQSRCAEYASLLSEADGTTEQLRRHVESLRGQLRAANLTPVDAPSPMATSGGGGGAVGGSTSEVSTAREGNATPRAAAAVGSGGAQAAIDDLRDRLRQERRARLEAEEKAHQMVLEQQRNIALLEQRLAAASERNNNASGGLVGGGGLGASSLSGGRVTAAAGGGGVHTPRGGMGSVHTTQSTPRFGFAHSPAAIRTTAATVAAGAPGGVVLSPSLPSIAAAPDSTVGSPLGGRSNGLGFRAATTVATSGDVAGAPNTMEVGGGGSNSFLALDPEASTLRGPMGSAAGDGMMLVSALHSPARARLATAPTSIRPELLVTPSTPAAAASPLVSDSAPAAAIGTTATTTSTTTAAPSQVAASSLHLSLDAIEREAAAAVGGRKPTQQRQQSVPGAAAGSNHRGLSPSFDADHNTVGGDDDDDDTRAVLESIEMQLQDVYKNLTDI